MSLAAGWQGPLIEFVSQPPCGLFPQHHSDNQGKVDAPCVVVALAAAPAIYGLPPFPGRPVIGGYDMCHFMQARLFARTQVAAVVHSDFDTALTCVSMADPLSAHHSKGVSVCREPGLEPVRLLDRIYVACAAPVVDHTAILD